MPAAITITGARELLDAFKSAETRALPAIAEVTIANGRALAELWRANARRTAGKHGRFYPASITSEEVRGFREVAVDVGPEKGKKQGGMGRGFEFGSVNQPPHLDGTKAAEVIEPQYLSEIELAAAGLL